MKKTKNHINSISNLPLPDIRTATDELARRLCEEQASRPEASGAKVVTKQSLYLDLEYASTQYLGTFSTKRRLPRCKIPLRLFCASQ